MFFQMFAVFSENMNFTVKYRVLGGCHLEDLSISRVINHVTCYKFDFSNWLKLQHSDWREYFQPMRALKFITGQMV